jgi:hypothetical protein
MIVPGSLVICINDNFPVLVWDYAREIPRKGNVYTVKDVGPGRDPVTRVSGPGLVLFELDNPWPRPDSKIQVRFSIWRFREYFVDTEDHDEQQELQPVEIGKE